MRARGLLLILGLVAICSSALATQDCILAATTSMEINLSSGVYTERAAVSSPLKIRIPTGINHAAGGLPPDPGEPHRPSDDRAGVADGQMPELDTQHTTRADGPRGVGAYPQRTRPIALSRLHAQRYRRRSAVAGFYGELSQ